MPIKCDRTLNSSPRVGLSLMNMKKKFCAALVIVDMQNDFMDTQYYKDSKLPVADANTTLIARVLDYFHAESVFQTVVITQDWHPEKHVSFFSTHAAEKQSSPGGNNAWKRKDSSFTPQKFQPCMITYPKPNPVDPTVLIQVNQMMWPEHCIQKSPGAALVTPLLDAMAAESLRAAAPLELRTFFLKKGNDVNVDSNSAVFDARNQLVTNLLHDLHGQSQATTMCDMLKTRNITDVFCVGVARDYCVVQTANGLAKHMKDLRVHVLVDGTRAFDPGVMPPLQKNVNLMQTFDVSESLRCCIYAMIGLSPGGGGVSSAVRGSNDPHEEKQPGSIGHEDGGWKEPLRQIDPSVIFSSVQVFDIGLHIVRVDPLLLRCLNGAWRSQIENLDMNKRAQIITACVKAFILEPPQSVHMAKQRQDGVRLALQYCGVLKHLQTDEWSCRLTALQTYGNRMCLCSTHTLPAHVIRLQKVVAQYMSDVVLSVDELGSYQAQNLTGVQVTITDFQQRCLEAFRFFCLD
jgi:nicotinamidase/pyrazinamidase